MKEFELFWWYWCLLSSFSTQNLQRTHRTYRKRGDSQHASKELDTRVVLECCLQWPCHAPWKLENWWKLPLYRTPSMLCTQCIHVWKVAVVKATYFRDTAYTYRYMRKHMNSKILASHDSSICHFFKKPWNYKNKYRRNCVFANERRKEGTPRENMVIR